ncbi:RHS repeat domain-containing protein [Paenibacillus rhizoplanae]
MLRDRCPKKVDGLKYSGNISSSKGTTYAYDGLGRLTKETNVLGDSKLYEYDVLNHLLARTDERGNTTSYEVNPDGTPGKIIYADGGVFLSIPLTSWAERLPRRIRLEQ